MSPEGPISISGNLEFDDVLYEWRLLHKDKNHDYANDGEPLSNFILQAEITGMSVDMVFFNAIAIKVARLKELVGGDKEPRNESITDTIRDMGIYSALWETWRRRETK